MTTQSERSIGERISGAAERPSEDLSRSWHMRKSPSCGIIFSGPTTGKWCIFVPSSDVDLAWTQVRVAVEEDKLLCAKVSTALRSMGRDGHVICVYTRDWADRQDLMRVREVLRSLGFVKELGYKRDIDTRNRIYGSGEWYLCA
ncbi:putative phosphothreonine lyase domain-containg protein [Paraburkholderia terricola]|uniref:putative phosphothreonine lyase domain-containing protein n=1 Tax=Paraburkholderia terricola TaxID=169427 RepID=UPI003CC7CBBA